MHCSMLHNVEDGAYIFDSSASMNECYFESNGSGGTGNGMSSVYSSKLSMERCVFSRHCNNSVGLRVRTGVQCEEEGGGRSNSKVSDDGSGSGSGNGVNSFIKSCQFIGNSIGCHVILSPEVTAPSIVGCKFFGNTKIGDQRCSKNAFSCLISVVCRFANCRRQHCEASTWNRHQRL